MSSTTVPSLTDAALARRLERTEASANVAFVEARARHSPPSGATWREVRGTYAMFDGVGSPLTQSFGLGMFAPATADDLAALERFFDERGADTHHEVSPLADPALLSLLPARGYQPIELTTVMHQPLGGTVGDAPSPSPRLATRRVREDELATWAEASAAGWGETPELAAFMREFGLITGLSRGVSCFVAEEDGLVIATGAMAIHGDVALLAGASTLPAFRGRGAQAALLAARLAHATAHGCTLAMMCAAPGSTSQTNAERRGFRIAYTRIKWRRPAATP